MKYALLIIGIAVISFCLGWAMASMCAAAKRGDEAAQEAWRKAQKKKATEQDK